MGKSICEKDIMHCTYPHCVCGVMREFRKDNLEEVSKDLVHYFNDCRHEGKKAQKDIVKQIIKNRL